MGSLVCCFKKTKTVSTNQNDVNVYEKNKNFNNKLIQPAHNTHNSNNINKQYETLSTYRSTNQITFPMDPKHIHQPINKSGPKLENKSIQQPKLPHMPPNPLLEPQQESDTNNKPYNNQNNHSIIETEINHKSETENIPKETKLHDNLLVYNIQEYDLQDCFGLQEQTIRKEINIDYNLDNDFNYKKSLYDYQQLQLEYNYIENLQNLEYLESLDPEFPIFIDNPEINIDQVEKKAPNIDLDTPIEFSFNRDVSDLNNNLEIKKSLAECLICLDKFDPTEKQNPNLDCGCIIHGTCFLEYVGTEVNSNKIPINCPNDYCKERIHANFIFTALRNNKYLTEKFEKYCFDLYLMNSKDVKCCFTPGCSNLFFSEMNELNFYCKSCDKT